MIKIHTIISILCKDIKGQIAKQWKDIKTSKEDIDVAQIFAESFVLFIFIQAEQGMSDATINNKYVAT